MLRHRIPQHRETLESKNLIETMDKKSANSSRFRKAVFWKLMLLLFVSIFIVVYVIVPLAFKFSPSFRGFLLFMNHVNVQIFMNISNPESEYGLNCTKVFRITTNDIELGAWHVYPSSQLEKCRSTKAVEGSFDDDRPVILYLHGNGGTRGGFHRRDLYRIFSNQPVDAHVVTIDYRGFADSSSVSPTVAGVTNDAIAAYTWLTKRVNPNRTILWGHSLGTAISLAMLKQVENGSLPKHLVLEAPLTSVHDAVPRHPLAKVYKFYPFFEFFFVEPTNTSDYSLFNSEQNIRSITLPILILHAEDDAIVPIDLGIRVYKSALTNPKAQVEMVIYKAELGYGHKLICKDPNFPQLIEHKLLIN